MTPVTEQRIVLTHPQTRHAYEFLFLAGSDRVLGLLAEGWTSMPELAPFAGVVVLRRRVGSAA